MKKALVISLFSFLLLVTSGLSAKAAYNFGENSGIKDVAKNAGFDINTVTQPEAYVGMILTILFSFVGLIFFGLALYAGIKWMTAQGNTSQVDQAKSTLTNAIIGLVVSLIAYALTFFIINFFQTNTNSTETEVQSRIILISNQT